MTGTGTAQRAADQKNTDDNSWQRSAPQTRQQGAASELSMLSSYGAAAEAAHLPETKNNDIPPCSSDNRSSKTSKEVGDRRACAPHPRAGPYVQVNSSEATLKQHVAILESELLHSRKPQAQHAKSEAELQQRVELEVLNNHKLEEQLATFMVSEAALKQRVESELQTNQQLQGQLAVAKASKATLEQHLWRLMSELVNTRSMQERLAAGMAVQAALTQRNICLRQQLQPVHTMQQEQGMQYCQQETLADTAMIFDDPSCNTTQAHTDSVANDMPMETMRPAKRQRVEPPGQPSMPAFRITDLPDSCIINIAGHLEGSSLLAFMATSRKLAKHTMDSLSMANKPLMTFRLFFNSTIEGFGQVMSWAHHIRLELEHVECRTTMNTAANCGSQYQARGVAEIRLQDESMLPALGNMAAFCPNAHALDVCFAVGDKHLEAIFNMPGLHKLRVHGINSLENDYSNRKVELKQLAIHCFYIDFASFAHFPLSGLTGPIEWTSPTAAQVVLMPDPFRPAISAMERAADNLRSIEGFRHAPIKCEKAFLHFVSPLWKDLFAEDGDDYDVSDHVTRMFQEAVHRQQDHIARECWPQQELQECHLVHSQYCKEIYQLDAYVLVTKDSSAGPNAVNDVNPIHCWKLEKEDQDLTTDVTGLYHCFKEEMSCA